MRQRQEVFRSHLELAATLDVDADLELNCSVDPVVLTGFEVFEGDDGIRALAELLRHQLPDARFTYTTAVVRGDVAFLEWTCLCREMPAELTGMPVRG